MAECIANGVESVVCEACAPPAQAEVVSEGLFGPVLASQIARFIGYLSPDLPHKNACGLGSGLAQQSAVVRGAEILVLRGAGNSLTGTHCFLINWLGVTLLALTRVPPGAGHCHQSGGLAESLGPCGGAFLPGRCTFSASHRVSPAEHEKERGRRPP